ncbi:MAG: DUF357 domain-containing protein [Candidatus Poseidoniales archaeon]|nr:MAG: DUF357 domain-containing protein [Candidatus Poseidoniales archaeon]
MTSELETVTVERIESYLDITRRAREKATPLVESTSAEGQRLAIMLRMADDYASDAAHFMNTGDLVRAFGAINYAHAWIDAGVKIGWLDGHGDDVLFTLP